MGYTQSHTKKKAKAKIGKNMSASLRGVAPSTSIPNDFFQRKLLPFSSEQAHSHRKEIKFLQRRGKTFHWSFGLNSLGAMIYLSLVMTVDFFAQNITDDCQTS